MQSTLNILYSTIKTKKKKERFETILEPLQAILQIGYLSFSPIGTKLTIRNNILQIQTPNYSQSVIRWYNNDTQEDLFYLFNIFCRFKKFYIDVKVEHTKLFELLILQAKNGINNLIRTYNQTDKTHVLHTLQMYKNMLDGTTYNYHNNMHPSPTTNAILVNPSSLIQLPILSLSSTNSLNTPTASNASTNNIQTIQTSTLDKNNKNYKNNALDKRNKINSKYENDKNENNVSNANASLADEKNHGNDGEKDINLTHMPTSPRRATPVEPTPHQPEIDMDTIFIKISELYSDEMFRIIYNAFIEMGRDDTNYIDYANGLNMMLHPINIRIKKWIDENIVF